jgi:2-polyprenyl-6-methoxyphenol hydroxylase-like FAD-dependent oxidoreductase
VSPARGRAIVIGASLAGLFAATLVRKAGWHTEAFERSHVELVGRGAGITTHPERLQSLVRSGASNHLGCSLAIIEQGPESVTAVFDNGRRETADLLAGADG